MDNEVSNRLINAIEEKNLNYQIASPHDHGLNSAERLIQMFKNHFISDLHGYDRDFPAYCLSEIIQQCEMTQNMLQRLRINPKLSAYTQMFGMFDYNQTLLAPQCIKALAHKRAKEWKSFANYPIFYRFDKFFLIP